MTIDHLHKVAGGGPPGSTSPGTSRRAVIYAYLAATWSLLYGGLALGWAIGIPRWPARPFAGGSGLPPLGSAVPPGIVAAVVLVGAGAAIAMANGWARRVTRSALLGGAWAIAAGLALGFTTEKTLIMVGYAPIYVVSALFDWAPDSYFSHFTWPIVHEMISLLGAGLWAVTAVWYGRRTAAGEATAEAGRVTRLDRAAVAVAIAVPVGYATIRYAWLLGIPLGVGEEFLREGQQTGMWIAGAGLATFAVVGAVLTLGLVQRWGEMFPRWMPVVRARPVPPALAVGPATVVSVLITAAGLSMWRGFLAEPETSSFAVMFATVAPGLAFPFWGLALGVATMGYQRRARSRARA